MPITRPLSTGPTRRRAGAPTHPALRPAPWSPGHALRGTLGFLSTPCAALFHPHTWAATPALCHKRSRDQPTRIRPARLVALMHLRTTARPMRQCFPTRASGLRGSWPPPYAIVDVPTSTSQVPDTTKGWSTGGPASTVPVWARGRANLECGYGKPLVGAAPGHAGTGKSLVAAPLRREADGGAGPTQPPRCSP